MLKVDLSLNHIAAERESVVALLESINQPLVNIPNHGTASTGAFILGIRNELGYYTVYVYLHQPETKAVIIYVSEPQNLTPDQYRAEEQEASRFVESMGFMVDDIGFPTLNISEQETVISRVPLFRPPERTVDLYEVADSRDVEPEPIEVDQDDMIFGSGPSGLGSALDLERTVPTSSPGAHRSPRGAQRPDRPRTIQGKPLSGAQPALPAAAGTSAAPRGSGTWPPPQHAATPAAVRTPAGTPLRAPPGPPAPPAGTGSPTVSTPVPSAPVGSGGPKSGPTVESLKRLGRLLATFVWLLVMVSGLACAGKTPEDDRAVQSQLDLAAQHLARGAWPDAVRTYSDVLKGDKDNRNALRGLGLAYLQLDRLDEAERYLRRVVELEPKWSVPKNELAVVLIERNLCGEAETLLDSVLEDIFYPTPEFARHNLARAMACQGRIEEAIGGLKNLVKRKPRFCLGYLTMSELASESERYEDTIEACDGFVRYCQEAEEIRDKVLPQHSAICYRRSGVAYAKLGDVESARAAFLRCEATGVLGDECRRLLNALPP